MKRIFIWLIKFYQKHISPLKKPSCIFIPTCSQYAVEAIQTHGAVKGLFLSIRRILRCHPFHKEGYNPIDPVPPKKSRDNVR